MSNPKCKGCGKPLRAITRGVYETVTRAKTDAEMEQERASRRGGVIIREWTHQNEVGREFSHWQGYEGFHSLRCALAFALAAYNAGYRRVGDA